MNEIKPQLGGVKENEVLLRSDGTWLHFRDPHHLMRIDTLADVLPALREIELLTQTRNWNAAGFLSYEAAPAFDPALRTRPRSEFPYLWFGLYSEPILVTLPQRRGSWKALDWIPAIDKAAYASAIADIKEHIAAGKTYQVNYTLRLLAQFKGSPWDFFLHLAQDHSNHAAYINIGRHVICSFSPELFFQLEGNSITSRPMKGTTPRGRTAFEDRKQAEWLRTSEKNRAENVMIVDMIRNDLGRIAQTGSVCVPELFKTERYPTLWQMTSTVHARTDASLADLFAALFPCASITGAPKVSTMNIIAELENTPRNIYTGAIGFIRPGRRAKFSVAIRTALVDLEQQRAEYGVGGGVVWDSTSSDEYAEALLKARVLDPEERPFSVLETMLWVPEEGFFLANKHVERMLDSAAYFEIPITKPALEAYLGDIASDFRTPQRVRILLDRAGGLAFDSHSIKLSGRTQPLKARLAKKPVDARNIFLFHKTTRREVYEEARKDFGDVDDVLLYNERLELTEFTIGNLVVEINGRRLTPPVSCGLLPGTFRAHLLETDQVAEAVIPVGRLKQCTAIFRINSVREWERVEMLT
jgi:para-aminobenzoate synthetase/4-amino-4-deoxychorismate lyase